jgi:hypothetical protein
MPNPKVTMTRAIRPDHRLGRQEVATTSHRLDAKSPRNGERKSPMAHCHPTTPLCVTWGDLTLAKVSLITLSTCPEPQPLWTRPKVPLESEQGRPPQTQVPSHLLPSDCATTSRQAHPPCFSLRRVMTTLRAHHREAQKDAERHHRNHRDARTAPKLACVANHHHSAPPRQSSKSHAATTNPSSPR